MTASIVISIDAYITLDDDEVFPDGTPDDLDADKVAEAIKATGSLTNWLRDWNLGDCVSVTVDVEDDDDGVQTRAEVWP